MNSDHNAAAMAIAYDNWGWLMVALVIGVIVGWMVRGRSEQKT